MSGVLPALELVFIGGPCHGETVRAMMGTDARVGGHLYRPLHANAHAKDSFHLRIEALAHESLSTEEARRMAVEWLLKQLVGEAVTA